MTNLLSAVAAVALLVTVGIPIATAQERPSVEPNGHLTSRAAQQAREAAELEAERRAFFAQPRPNFPFPNQEDPAVGAPPE